MGTAREHFGYDPEKAGKQTARDMKNGKISKEELKKRYEDAKFRGQGEEFKKGYAGGASE